MGSKLQNATCFLMFSAMSEIMLDMYQYMHMMIQYDPALENKLKNLKANFERVSKIAYAKFDEGEQLTFFYMIKVFEKLIEAAKDRRKFDELMGIIDAWEKGDLTMIASTQQLIETAEMAKTRRLNEDNSIQHLRDSD